MVGHITLHGEITPYEEGNPASKRAVNLNSVSAEINSQPEATEFEVHIHSPGGDIIEAWAIHDRIRSTGKKITTIIEGLCASAASIIALAGDDRKMTENSKFMIHLPVAQQKGTAEQMQKASDFLSEVENKAAEFYAISTKGTAEEMMALMKEETWMDSAEALAKGFVTEIITTIKAVATINLKSKNMATTMTAEEVKTMLDKNSTGLLAKFKELIKGSPKMITVTTGDGAILDFGDSVEEESQIAVGSTATVDGSPAEGEYTMTDGRVLVFAGGAVTEIREAETVEALKQQLADKDAKIAELEASMKTEQDENKKNSEAVVALKAEFDGFKTKMVSDIGGGEGGDFEKDHKKGDEKRHLFKKKEE